MPVTNRCCGVFPVLRGRLSTRGPITDPPSPPFSGRLTISGDGQLRLCVWEGPLHDSWWAPPGPDRVPTA